MVQDTLLETVLLVLILYLALLLLPVVDLALAIKVVPQEQVVLVVLVVVGVVKQTVPVAQGIHRRSLHHRVIMVVVEELLQLMKLEGAVVVEQVKLVVMPGRQPRTGVMVGTVLLLLLLGFLPLMQVVVVVVLVLVAQQVLVVLAVVEMDMAVQVVSPQALEPPIPAGVVAVVAVVVLLVSVAQAALA